MHRLIDHSSCLFFAFMLVLTLTIPVQLQAQDGRSVTSEMTSSNKSDSSRSGILFDELAHMDHLLFSTSFVTCDAKQIDALMTDDIEFYHDLTGFSSGQRVRNNNAVLAKNCPRQRGITRKLVEGSLRVYPLKNYGAIQMGTHYFVQENAPTSTVAKFVHLWKKTGGGKGTEEKWKISRVLSFDHLSVESTADTLPHFAPGLSQQEIEK